MSRVLVTGATGFVGRHLCVVLTAAGHEVRAAIRSPGATTPGAAQVEVVGELSAQNSWARALDGVDCVVHLAAKAHVLDQPHDDGEYHRVNAEATRSLAVAAAEQGVRRFVFLSSIKVYGDGREQPFTSSEAPIPTDVYGKSKLAAEQYLREVAQVSSLETVIVRPPLVYGPEVRANFLRLMQMVDRERPLPLGAVHNRRSLVSLDNLCDFLRCMVTHSAAAGGTWLVSDGDDVSTPELIRRIATAMGRRVRLLAVPTQLLRVAAAVTGRGADISRLCNSLTLDISATRRELGWQPPHAQVESIQMVVSWYLAQARHG